MNPLGFAPFPPHPPLTSTVHGLDEGVGSEVQFVHPTASDRRRDLPPPDLEGWGGVAFPQQGPGRYFRMREPGWAEGNARESSMRRVLARPGHTVGNECEGNSQIFLIKLCDPISWFTNFADHKGSR